MSSFHAGASQEVPAAVLCAYDSAVGTTEDSRGMEKNLGTEKERCAWDAGHTDWLAGFAAR